MTEKPEQQHVTLPPGVLAVIKSIAADAGLSAGERLVGTLMLVYGYAWYDQQESVDPTQVALPSVQWREVCGYLTAGAPGDKFSQVNLGLSWMNSGPSSYED